MPVLGLGVWRSAPGPETRSAVGAALGLGYRSIDTATLYRNERDVGAAIREAGLLREEVFVTTKVWNDDQGFEPARAAAERSRAALGIGRIDLYLIHWPISEKRLETWRALVRLREEGQVRSIGVSNFTVAHLEELRRSSDVVPAVDQVEFNPFLFQSDLLEYCRDHGIQLEAYAPLGRGRRLGDPRLTGVAAAHGRSPAQVMLRWALQHDVVVIPKSVHADRIGENSRVFDFELSAAEMAELDALHDGTRAATDPARFA